MELILLSMFKDSLSENFLVITIPKYLTSFLTGNVDEGNVDGVTAKNWHEITFVKVGSQPRGHRKCLDSVNSQGNKHSIL